MKKKLNTIDKYIIMIPIILVISLLLELFVFNFRHYESLSYKETNLYTDKYIASTGEDYIEFKDINKKINNIYIDIDNHKDEAINLEIYATDEANQKYFELPEKEIYNGLKQMKYIKINLSGKTDKLKIKYEDNADINSIKINVNKPLFISKLRILLLFVSLYVLFLIRPKSELYNYKLLNNKYSKYIVLGYVLVQSIFFISIVNMNPMFTDKSLYLENQHQYELLAQSLANKQVNINFEESEILKNMENPYDFVLRVDLLRENNEPEHLDFAYFNHKFYVYFGIIPCLIFYLPYYLITGNNMHNYIVISILLVLTTIAILKLLKVFVEKYFKNISIIHYLLVGALFINTCGLLYIAKRPDFYSVPILTALCFTIYGLYFWFSSIKDNRINKVRLTIGSICMALVAGCRPQFLLGSFFSLIIFKDYFIDSLKNNKKDLIKSILCFAIPYILVAAGIMYYNNIRFGSPFDFGANYNLTGNDMTRRGFNYDRIGLGIYYFLLSVPVLIPLFPFAQYSDVQTNYMGFTMGEPLFGGLFFKNIILLLGLISFKLKKIINNKTLFYISVLANIFGIIIVIVDTQMAGILPRYTSDFAWLFYLSTAISIFAIINHFEDKKNRTTILNSILLILFIYGIFYAFIEIPTDLSLTIKEFAPFAYYKFYSLIQFWI